MQKAIDDGFHFDSVEEANRILTKEVESDLVVALKPDMLTPKRAAPNSVCLVLSFLIAHSERKLVNKVSAHSNLVVKSVVHIHLLVIVVANATDGIL